MQSILTRGATATALALVLSVGAYAQDPSGFVGAGISNTNIDVGGFEEDVTGYDIGGAYFNNLGGLNLQASVVYNYLDTEPDSVDGFGGELNLFARDSNSHAFGGFIDVAESDDSTLWGGGGEGQLFRDSWTVGASAAYFAGGDSFDSAFGACGFARMYGSENFAIEGRGTLANVDFGGGDANAYGVGAGAEYQFMGSPFSITGDVDYASLDDVDVDATSLRLGGIWHFGTTDLVTRDRIGAGMRGGNCVSGVAGL